MCRWITAKTLMISVRGKKFDVFRCGEEEVGRIERKMASNERTPLSFWSKCFLFQLLLIIWCVCSPTPNPMRNESLIWSLQKGENQRTQKKNNNIKVAIQIPIFRPTRKKKCATKKERKRKLSARNEIKMFIDEAVRSVRWSWEGIFPRNRLSVFIFYFIFFFLRSVGPSMDNNNNNLYKRRLILTSSDDCPCPSPWVLA